MKVSFSDQKKFILFAIKKHLGLLGIWLVFIVFGSFFAFLGYNVEEDGLMFIVFGVGFILLISAFMLFTLPSSLMYYYEQALVKKYGSYTFAKITNKRIDDYTHTSSSLNGGQSKKTVQFLYAIEFEFTYNNQVYQSECFFDQQSTYDAINLETELPIKFLKNNPKKVTLRRRKLASQIGIPEKMCQ